MAMNRMRLEVCGVVCALLTEESEEYMEALRAEAEALISGLQTASGTVSVAAVTAALSYLDEKKKLEERLKAETERAEKALQELKKLQEQKGTAAPESGNDEEKQELQKSLRLMEEKAASLERQAAEQAAQLEKMAEKLAEKPVEKRPAVKTEGPLKNPLREFENISGEGLVSFYEKKS